MAGSAGPNWAGEGTVFTTLLGMRRVDFDLQVPVWGVAGETHVHGDSGWRILRHYVETVPSRQALSSLTATDRALLP